MSHGAVLWRGDAGIPGAKEAIELLRSLGKRVVFVVRCWYLSACAAVSYDGVHWSVFMLQTNNSTKSRETYVKVLGAELLVAV